MPMQDTTSPAPAPRCSRRIWLSGWLACLIGVGCDDSSPQDCSAATGTTADLCWAEQAEALMKTDSDGAIAAAENIGDDRLHDIALLTIHKHLSEPGKRVEACELIRAEAPKKKCMTYEVRVHLWKDREQGAVSATQTTEPKQANRPECSGLPAQFQDACELESILSRAQKPSDATDAPNTEQCLAIGDLEARALCQTEVAALVSRKQGIDSGVTACKSIETELFRNDCLLRVRANHPDAPVKRQQEICRMAGDLYNTCQSMITISAAAHMLDKHGDKPVVEALTAIDQDLQDYHGVLEATYETQQTTLTYRSIWFRVFARLIHARYKASDDLIATSRALVQIHDQFEATDPRRSLFRASMLRGFTFLMCNANQRKIRPKPNEGTASSSPKKPRLEKSDPRCKHPGQLAALLQEREQELRAQVSSDAALSQPLHTDKIDTRDWWVVYKTDMGMLPRSFVRDCPMRPAEADELAALSMLSNGSWESNADAFLVGLQSEFATVRSLTIHRLTRRLFNEWRTMPDQASTSDQLKSWLPQLDDAMRAHVQGLVDTVDQGSQSPARFIGEGWCPDPSWPQAP